MVVSSSCNVHLASITVFVVLVIWSMNVLPGGWCTLYFVHGPILIADENRITDIVYLVTIPIFGRCHAL